MLSFLSSLELSALTYAENIEIIVNILTDRYESIEDNEEIKLKLALIIEQLKLTTMKQIRYSPEMLFLDCKLYYSYPVVYNMMIKCHFITLPHPSYSKKIALSLNYREYVDPINQHVNYL